MDTTLDGYASRIRDQLPDMPVREIQWLARGQNNDALLVNGAIVFRFPRYADGIEQLRREVAILRLVGPSVPLPVPQPSYVNLSADVGSAFAGYAMLPGEPLSQCALTDADARRVGAQLGAFLTGLHGVSPDPAQVGSELSPRWMVEPWERLYHDIRELLFPMMRSDARTGVSRHFEAFLHDYRAATIDPVLVHGDFGASNILYDRSAGSVSGVIDFSSAHVGDPAIDIAAASTIHPVVRERLVQDYPADAGLPRRVDFYLGTFALQEAVFGARTGDEDALRAGLAGYSG